MSAARRSHTRRQPDSDPILARLRELAGPLLEDPLLADPSAVTLLTLATPTRTLTIRVGPPRVEPPDPDGRPLTPCERDALTVLVRAGRRLTTSRVLEAMEVARLAAARQGSDRFDHGESTVRQALTRLTKDRLLESSRVAPRGYSPTEAGRKCVGLDSDTSPA